MFLAQQKRARIAHLTLDDIQAEAVLAFLQDVESRRGNSAATRNCRLAALRSFAQHLLWHDVIRAGQYSRILAIPTKRATRRTSVYLEPEARAVIAAVDRRVPNGNRNYALLLFLYNTGARVSEALSVPGTSGWSGPDKCDCWAKGERNEYAGYGRTRHQRCVASLPLEGQKSADSEVRAEHR